MSRHPARAVPGAAATLATAPLHGRSGICGALTSLPASQACRTCGVTSLAGGLRQGGPAADQDDGGTRAVAETVTGAQMSERFHFVVRTQPGLEHSLCDEFAKLHGMQGVSDVRVVPHEGAVEFTAPWSSVYTVAHMSRLANKMTVRVGDMFSCPTPETLVSAIAEAPWESFLDPRSLRDLPVRIVGFETSVLVEIVSSHHRIMDVIDKALRDVASLPMGATTSSASTASSSSSIGSGSGSDRHAGSKHRPQWSGYSLGLYFAFRGDTCSLEMTCTGRLALRPYVFLSPEMSQSGGSVSEIQAVAKPIATPYRYEVLGFGNAPASLSWSLQRSTGPAGKTIRGIVSNEWHGTKDLSSNYAAALVNQLPLAKLLADASGTSGGNKGGGLVVWDPFCGNGSLLLEVLAKALGVAPRMPCNMLPCRELRPHCAESVAAAARSDAAASLENLDSLTLVGTDISATSILRARRLLHRFSTFYADAIPARRVVRPDDGMDIRPRGPKPQLIRSPGFLDDDAILEKRGPAAPRFGASSVMPASRKKGAKSRHASKPLPAEVGSHSLGAGHAEGAKPEQAGVPLSREVLQSFSSSRDPEWGISLPCEVSLSSAPFEDVAPHIAGALVVTKVPLEVRALGSTSRIRSLYTRFGHFLAGRRDFLGVYVIAEGPDFKRVSGLTWEVLLSFTDHAGRKCQVLRMLGATNKLGRLKPR